MGFYFITIIIFLNSLQFNYLMLIYNILKIEVVRFVGNRLLISWPRVRENASVKSKHNWFGEF